MLLTSDDRWPLIGQWGQRLTERIREAGRQVTLVVAPACWGKSEIAAAILAGEPARSALVSVDEEHRDLLGFVWGLADALSHLTDGPALSFTALLERLPLQSDRVAALAAWMSSHLSSVEATIVLDGLETIDEQSDVLRLIDDLIRAQPHLRWVLTSRTVGSLPVASWMARGIMNVPIDCAALRVRPSESPLYAAFGGWPLGVAWRAAGRSGPGSAVSDEEATNVGWSTRARASASTKAR